MQLIMTDSYDEAAVSMGVQTQSLEPLGDFLKQLARSAFEDVTRPVSDDVRMQHISDVAQVAVASIPELEAIKNLPGFGGSHDVDDVGKPIQNVNQDEVAFDKTGKNKDENYRC